MILTTPHINVYTVWIFLRVREVGETDFQNLLRDSAGVMNYKSGYWLSRYDLIDVSLSLRLNAYSFLITLVAEYRPLQLLVCSIDQWHTSVYNREKEKYLYKSS